MVSSEGWTASPCGLFHHDAIEPIWLTSNIPINIRIGNANGHLEGVGFIKPILVEILDVIDSGIALCNLHWKVRLEGDIVLPKLAPELFIMGRTVPSHIEHAVFRTVCNPTLTEVS